MTCKGRRLPVILRPRPPNLEGIFVIYRIKNWQDFQHYKDRSPAWIKLHASLLTSELWVMGSDASRALAIACMLLASRNKAMDGTFNGDPEYIKRFAYLNSKPDFKPLINHDFIECVADASNVLAFCTTEERRVEDINTPSQGKPDDGFEEFWKAYPKKEAKGAALKAWGKLRPNTETRQAILNALEWQRVSADWKKENGQFIPQPPAYLNKQRWLDEPVKLNGSDVSDFRKGLL